MTKFSTAARKAIAAYQDAIKRQVTLPADEQWRLGTEIKRLKAAAYVEIEAAKLRAA